MPTKSSVLLGCLLFSKKRRSFGVTEDMLHVITLITYYFKIIKTSQAVNSYRSQLSIIIDKSIILY